MQIRFFKITALLFLALSGFFASGSDFLHKNKGELAKNEVILKESLRKDPSYPFNYELILNNVPVQVLNIQQHRVIQFSHGVNNRPPAYNISVSYLNFICGQGNSELSHFRRLILFPFHVFW